MLKTVVLRLGLIVAALLAAQPALAQSVRVLSDHNAWTAYQTTDSASQICFVISRPTSSTPSGLSEGYFYITHRPGQAVRSEINIVPGYDFAAGGSAQLTVGSQSFALLAQGDSAWLADAGQASEALQAIRGGSTMTVSGTNAAGQVVSQSFSLMGATAATNAIDNAC